MNRLPHPLALALDPSLILAAQGIAPDPWQRQLLLSDERWVLLNCSRQAGKSTTVAALALHTALFRSGSLTLLLSRSQRQAGELFRKVLDAYHALRQPVPPAGRSLTRLELKNGSRIICLPGREETIRAFSAVALLLIDEAARVPDGLYRALRPMLAVSRGRLVALSTPFGRRGFFHQEWTGDGPWHRVRVEWSQCPRISPAFIEEERRSMGDAWVRQEYECSFEAQEGLVYADFAARCDWDGTGVPQGRAVGGIDWGYRNPFAAVWGVLDRDDVLWLTDERYVREAPLHEHAAALPRGVTWYADPAGPGEIAALRQAGFVVRRGDNAIAAGVAAVQARLRTGRLKVSRPGCANLLSEATRYRYPSASEQAGGEVPLDAHNHALGALRYLIARLDAGFVARFLKKQRQSQDSMDV